MDKHWNHRRLGIQAVAALLQNANLKGFLTGKLSAAPTKAVCVPGLNCYSCPGAVGACPIGSLQSFLSARPVRLPYYVVGFLLFFGALLGRAVCGFLCPFGLLQDLISRIPFPRKKLPARLDWALRKVKYGILALMLLLPLLFPLVPFFCKYLCPSGTVSGIALVLADPRLQPLLGGIFSWKVSVLAAVLLGCLAVRRFFCRYLCPLGAIYGFFNRIALLQLTVDAAQCTGCGSCTRACPMEVDPVKNPNSAECIRCGSCCAACPHSVLHLGFRKPKG